MSQVTACSEFGQDKPQIHPLLRATHYVLDLETLGKGPNAAIATIGCVRIENGVIGDGLYIRVDVDSAIGFGGETDASTIDFWLKQSEEAQREIHQGFNRVKINNALIQLADFIDRPAAVYGESYVWGNGATFDNVIISTAFQRAHVPRPWQNRNDRDLRTITDLYPEAKKSVQFVGLKHHALDDAMHEARILVAALKLHIARSPA
ncbi:3'-5' exonuclease [Phytopseudomonas punonensis]|uniref:Exodeoxyribonuclease VIII n=1 Tax=Phytopseudomonas punonensis TaxID=1220495 RepID=A0A1M7LKF2_9GAMM|nr:3'-5' exonuclease [Pseudomonas punonensis]SHM78503.1 exodeoxyribonuclease VIII [Pseudomonas punonensis]